MNKINDQILMYKIYIYEKSLYLVRSGKPLEFWDNYDISKIFEYFFCIKWMQEKKQICHQYDHIHPDIKEENDMSQNDTGIDCSNLTDMIAQCKLRDKTLTWTDCSTFIASQNSFDEKTKKTIIKWDNLVLGRNSESKLATNLLRKKKLFSDITYDRSEIIEFCQNLLDNAPLYPKAKHLLKFKLRDYQVESIDLIKNNNQNVIICLPTGCGKNIIMIYAMKKDCKYLILVPRIILMEQLKQEIIDHKPELLNEIQMIGDTNNKFFVNKKITICVFNSVCIINDHVDKFDKIFIDEAHHVLIPEIYTIDNTGCEDNEQNENNQDNEGHEDNEDNAENEKNEEYEDNEDNEDNLNKDDNEDNEENTDNDDNENNEENDDENDDVEDNENEIIEENQDNDDENDENDEKDENCENHDENNEKCEVEIKNNYLQTIRSFKQYNNNVYLSATIDEHQGFKYYKKDKREMIEKKYLCDYVIKVPIFTDDPTNRNICEYLIERYRNIIIYCHSRKEGKAINKIFNKLLPNSCEYIDCVTPKLKRNQIIEKYKQGVLPYLVNIRILVEGFNAPITKGICFIHMPSSKTSIIQIIGRALRLHLMKTLANVILPFSSKRDETSINKFLKIMARNDTRIKKSYESAKLGGYISLDEIDCKENDHVKLRYEIVYDNMAILQNRNDIWNLKKNLLFEYADANKHTRSGNFIYKNYNIGYFFTDQKKIITDTNHDLYVKLAENKYVKESIDKYLETREKNIHLIKLSQKEWIELLFEYCKENKTKPTRVTIYKERNLGEWYHTQQKKINSIDDNFYKKLAENEYIKENLDIIIKNKKKQKKPKFSQDEWIKLLLEFCEKKNRIPINREIYKDRNIGNWYNDKKNKINSSDDQLYKNICINKYIVNDLNRLFELRKKNKNLKKLNRIEWKNLLFKYCDEYDKVPLTGVIYDDLYLGRWFNAQKKSLRTGSKNVYNELSKNKCVKNYLDEYLKNKNLK